MSVSEKEIKEEFRVLNELEGKRAELSEAISNQKKFICGRYCPVKIGDHVVANGYSHSGKTIAVSSISLHTRVGGYVFKAKGSIIKTDGSIGLHSGERELTIAN